MKQKFFTLAIIILSCISLFSQNPTWKWAKGTGGANKDEGQKIAVDSKGNIIIAGTFESPSITFGTYTLTNNGTLNSDIFVVKYDQNGNVKWAKSFGGSYFDFINGIATDKNNNIYLTGNYSSTTMNIGSIVLTNYGYQSADIYIAKYDSSGNVLWAKGAGGTSMDRANCLVVDDTGNIYIGGGFYSAPMNIGTSVLNTSTDGYEDILLAKYRSNGDFIWAKSADGNFNEYISSICIDNNGLINVGGSTCSTILNIGGFTLTNKGSYDFLIIKYGPDGRVIKAFSDGGPTDDQLTAITTDDKGKIYVGGYFWGDSINLGYITFKNKNKSYTDIVFVKYDTSGKVIWAKQAASSSIDYVHSIFSDHLANIYASGTFYEKSITFDTISKYIYNKNTAGFFVKFDSSGIYKWVKVFNSSDSKCGIAIYNNTELFITGGIPMDTLHLDNIDLLRKTQSLDVFVAKLEQCNPAPPTISKIGNNLVSTDATTYKWYLNGNEINGATSKTYTPTQNGNYMVQITDSYGCIATSLPYYYHGVGINDDYKTAQIAIYPNPTTGRFTILLPDETRNITIYNHSGQLILSQNKFGKSVSEFELNENGLYFIRISSKDNVYTRKLVVLSK